jgi:hypothetical protein
MQGCETFWHCPGTQHHAEDGAAAGHWSWLDLQGLRSVLHTLGKYSLVNSSGLGILVCVCELLIQHLYYISMQIFYFFFSLNSLWLFKKEFVHLIYITYMFL